MQLGSNALHYFKGLLKGPRPPPVSDRVLLTVLFTDIVGSTSVAAELGDRRWSELLQRHDDAVRAELRRFGGIEIRTTGDGFVAAFHGPSRAILCADAIHHSTAAFGLRLRAALHTGECERRGKDLSGMALHLASRLLDHAGSGEVVASRTVRELVIGADVAFEDRGEATLRDVPGTWQLYLVKVEPAREATLDGPK